MRIALFIAFALTTFHSLGQRIDDYGAFNGFDTLDILKTWQYQREYYGKDSVKYEVRYKMWGKGCIDVSNVESSKKCRFYIQEQLWRKDGSLEWKHGIWGHRVGRQVKESQVFYWYVKSGKLAQKTRKKKRYTLE